MSDAVKIALIGAAVSILSLIIQTISAYVLTKVHKAVNTNFSHLNAQLDTALDRNRDLQEAHAATEAAKPKET